MASRGNSQSCDRLLRLAIVGFQALARLILSYALRCMLQVEWSLAPARNYLCLLRLAQLYNSVHTVCARRQIRRYPRLHESMMGGRPYGST